MLKRLVCHVAVDVWIPAYAEDVGKVGDVVLLWYVLIYGSLEAVEDDDACVSVAVQLQGLTKGHDGLYDVLLTLLAIPGNLLVESCTIHLSNSFDSSAVGDAIDGELPFVECAGSWLSEDLGSSCFQFFWDLSFSAVLSDDPAHDEALEEDAAFHNVQEFRKLCD